MTTKCFVYLMLSLVAVSVLAHTPEETNAVVRAMLEHATLGWNDNLSEGGPWMGGGEPPLTWNGFLGRGEIDGWSQQARKNAFAWYLSTLGTNDCTSFTTTDRDLVQTALFECRTLNYEESGPSLKALALNPNGIYRKDAIKLAVQFCLIDDSMTAFTETIMTNTAGYTPRESGMASCQYANRLLSFNATNAVQIAYRDNAVRMFYRNRMSDAAGTEIVDELFGRYIAGYGTSSNRLAFALNALASPNCVRPDKQYFTSVTNQLLSSGQPLVQLNIGEEE